MNETKKILVTGATGFIGQALIAALRKSPAVVVVAASRSNVSAPGIMDHRDHDLLDIQRLPPLSDVDVVIHTAARVHVMDDKSTDKLAAFRAANVAGTQALAEAAVQAGVKRFIYLSSIKVNGESTEPGKPFTAFDTPNPQDPYGISKWEAELVLREIETRTGMEVVIIRPPLVYGPGVKANFRGMMKWLDRGVPMPLGAINNRRSLVALGNLVDLLVLCTLHPNAAGETFLVSDGEDISTTQLLRRLGHALGSRSILIAVPAPLLMMAARVLNRRAVAQRLCGWLQVDIAHNRETLGWMPPMTVEEGFQVAARSLLGE